MKKQQLIQRKMDIIRRNRREPSFDAQSQRTKIQQIGTSQKENQQVGTSQKENQQVGTRQTENQQEVIQQKENKKRNVVKENQKKGKNSMTVMERIQEHLRNEGVDFDIRDDNEAVRFNVGSEIIEEPLLCTVFADEDSFVTVVDLPFECDMSCLDEMAKLIVQINCGLWMGGFDLDYDDGELSFKVFANAMDTLPSDETIGTVIVSAVKSIELNYEDMYQVATGAQTAREIIYANDTKIEQ